ELAWEIRAYLHERGVEELAFESIVASGTNAAKPHYRAGSAKISAAAPLLIDMGARVEGYCADLTRTVFLDGTGQDRFREIHAVVSEAQQASIAAIRPGVQGGEVDAPGRQVIEDAGYGEEFGHGLGHGVGLAVHERPTLRRRSEDVLEAGMVLTVEPGIYLAGWGGIRIEDVVLVTETGGEVLTAAARDPFLAI
ncbi:MAG: M24 family metallopeptidase, partial [Anaerolineae bacterium]